MFVSVLSGPAFQPFSFSKVLIASLICQVLVILSLLVFVTSVSIEREGQGLYTAYSRIQLQLQQRAKIPCAGLRSLL
jgi:hypothetical protein